MLSEYIYYFFSLMVTVKFIHSNNILTILVRTVRLYKDPEPSLYFTKMEKKNGHIYLKLVNSTMIIYPSIQ